ncbi:MAG TPA: hypothetical protein VF906_05190 [Candidatus Bathyarchaeia archaeon]
MLLDVFSHIVPAELHGWIIPVSALPFVRVHVAFRDPVEDSIHPTAILESQEPKNSIVTVEENNVVTGTPTKSLDGGHPQSNILTEDEPLVN